MTATVIVVTSGKGGVGKTTTSAAFGTALALRGYKTCVVDFDVGLRKLDLAFGVEKRVVFDSIQVIQRRAKLGQALVKVKDRRLDNLYILPTSQTHDKDALTPEGVEAIMTQLKRDFDWIICDSPAGIEHGAIMALYHADHAIVVTNPEISSVRDSDRILGIIASKSRRAEFSEEGADPVREHLLITRYNHDRVARGQMMPVKDVQDILAAPLLGIIPESEAILEASNSGLPATLDGKTDVGEAYRDAVARFLGDEGIGEVDLDPPPAVATKPVNERSGRPGFLARLFGRR